MIKNIELNFNRLCQEEYTIRRVFQDNNSYTWPGDWEGRALLPAIQKLYEDEEIQREFEQWRAERQKLQRNKTYIENKSR